MVQQECIVSVSIKKTKKIVVIFISNFIWVEKLYSFLPLWNNIEQV